MYVSDRQLQLQCNANRARALITITKAHRKGGYGIKCARRFLVVGARKEERLCKCAILYAQPAKPTDVIKTWRTWDEDEASQCRGTDTWKSLLLSFIARNHEKFRTCVYCMLILRADPVVFSPSITTTISNYYVDFLSEYFAKKTTSGVNIKLAPNMLLHIM